MGRSLHSRFQVEIQRLSQLVKMEVVTYAIDDRRGTRLEAQTQCQDPFHNHVLFYVRNAETFEQVLTKLQAQFIHRGYAPLRYRLREENPATGATKWREWEPIEGGLDAVEKMISDSIAASRNP